MRILAAALLSAILISLASPAPQINNSDQRVKAQAVQAEAGRNPATFARDINVPTKQEKAQTEQQVDTEPETVAATPEPVKAQEPAPQPPTDHQTLMKQAGIAVGDFNATDFIVTKESTWCPYRWNGDHRDCDTIAQNPGNASMGSGAYGLCQALPAIKMASEGEDYMTNAVTQLRWCHKYAGERYGGWWSSFAFWRANSWW